MACAAAPCSVATAVTAAARSPASSAARACSSTPAAGSPTSTVSPWRIVTRSCARAQRRVSSGLPSVGRMRRGQRLARRRREGQAQCGLGGRRRVGEARQRRRRAGQVAELLARGQRQGGGLHQGRVSAFSRGEAGLDRLSVGSPLRQLSVCTAAIRASSGARFGGCRCSSAATRRSSGARSGGGAAAASGGGRCSRAAHPRGQAVPDPGPAAADAVRAGSPGPPARRAGAPGHRSGRSETGGTAGCCQTQISAAGQDDEAGAGQPGQQVPPARRLRRRAAAPAVRLPAPAAGRSVHSSQQREHRVLVGLGGDADASPGERL